MNDPFLWTLISIQVCMGAFDTLVHHEGTERLAWRASQRRELQLHGVRNAFYALIFLAFAWTEPHGVFTMILGAILIIEVFITLWDFVEEDLTRKLPATERINHTLLALNYGAILVLAAPVLYGWASLETALLPANYGWWSVFATLSAAGVGVFGVRDLLASARSDRLARPDAARLVADMPIGQRILITGGTGFIGRRLVEALVGAGNRVTVLTRSLKAADDLRHPVRIITNLSAIPDDEHLDAIINLAGEPIANGLWTRAKRARIINSRVDMTVAVADLVTRLDHKPDVVISGSAIGWYGLRGDEMLGEDADPKSCFTHEVCATWEAAADRIEGPRVVKLRLGLVLGVDGGMLAKLLFPFEFGLGGPMGSGRHWMSWITLDDVIRLISFAIASPDLDGPMNATAPHPVRNEDFTVALAAALHRPAIFRIPAGLLKRALGEFGIETMLSGQRVIPEKARRAGFEFWYPDIAPMLHEITGAKPNPLAPAREAHRTA